jgi:hypothetical protein
MSRSGRPDGQLFQENNARPTACREDTSRAAFRTQRLDDRSADRRPDRVHCVLGHAVRGNDAASSIGASKIRCTGRSAAIPSRPGGRWQPAIRDLEFRVHHGSASQLERDVDEIGEVEEQ